MPHFECGAFNHSATSPSGRVVGLGPPRGEAAQYQAARPRASGFARLPSKILRAKHPRLTSRGARHRKPNGLSWLAAATFAFFGLAEPFDFAEPFDLAEIARNRIPEGETAAGLQSTRFNCKEAGRVFQGAEPDRTRGRTMFAVIKTGGKQYRVAADEKITVMSLEGEAGSVVTFSDVLMVEKDGAAQIGAPFVAGATVKGEIVEQARGPKVISFKKRRRKNSKRKRGHRQDLTIVRITEVVA
jgi:large subunit ribosomal protein L21